jgi:hypothetical protein
MRLVPRLQLVAAFSLALTGSVLAQSGPPGGSAATAPNKNSPIPASKPIVFYLAKGKPHACGPDCGEWIAAEGSFDSGAAQRLRTLLLRLPRRKPPIFFHSPGGIQAQAYAVGRLLREHKMTAGVAVTIPTECASTNDKGQACAALKRSGRQVMAELRPVGAGCASACVYAFIGASVRQVRPGARLGVHSAKLVQVYRDGRVRNAPKEVLASGRAESLRADLRRYIGEMGIDVGLSHLIATVPFEQIRYLSRNEIAAFGIDTHEFEESPWTIVPVPPDRSVLAKFFVEARGSTGKEFRTNVVGVSCASANRLSIFYSRGLPSNQTEETRVFDIAVADRKVAFSKDGFVRKIDTFDTGSSFDTRRALVPLEFFDASAAAGSVEIIEADPTTPTVPARVIKLSTDGLAEGISTLRRLCSNPA